MRWWDYTGYFLNINGRITLSFTFLWGFASLIIVKFIHPFIKKIVGNLSGKIPYKFQHITINILLFLMIVDTLISSVNYLNVF